MKRNRQDNQSRTSMTVGDNKVQTNLGSKRWVWCDLEMTGLNLREHHIIEIATIITDENLNTIAEGPNYVVHLADELLQDLDPWIIKHHGDSGLLDAVRNSKISHQQAQKETLDFIKAHTEENTSPLCGNSIGTDRAFLKEHMPEIESYLHYRNIDVTSIKTVVDAWSLSKATYKKQNQHRALDDIKESIAELAYYRDVFTRSHNISDEK